MSTILDQMGGMSLKLGGEDLRRQIAQEVLDMRALSTEYQALSDAVKSGFQMDRQADQMDRGHKALCRVRRHDRKVSTPTRYPSRGKSSPR